MAISAAQSVSRELGNLLVEEAMFLHGLEDKVHELQQELAWMQGFLHDVDKRQHKEELIQMWVTQVRDLAYKAQDIVEKYIHQVSTQRMGNNQYWDCVKQLSCIIADAPTIQEVGSDIENLTNKILKLNARLVSYGVKITHVEDSLYVNKLKDLRPTTYPDTDTVEKDIIKRVDDTTKAVNELLYNHSNVVGVVGIGGLGKTTLAREIFRNNRLRKRFDCLAWVYIPQKPRERLVHEEILRVLLNTDATVDVQSLSDGALCDRINLVLTEKRCLVVLDGIWNKESWLLLKRAFSSILELSGSKILLSTRNEEVVTFVDSNAFILKPTPLNDEESWMLLRKKAFPRKDDAEIDPNMKELGTRMLKHCDGLPIAIVSLGGILATRNTIDGWKEVEEHISKAILSQNESIMEMSYNDLPFYMKPCFLCLGNFPQGIEIHTDTLYQLWQAEGLVRAVEDNGLDQVGVYEIAEQYLNELVQRCIIEVGGVYENGRIKTCRMHDVMRDLCLSKSKEEKFLEVCVMKGDDEEGRVLSTRRRVSRCHRVVVHAEASQQQLDKLVNWMEESVDFKPRSAFVFIPFTYNEGDSFFDIWLSKMSKSFRLLRVLRFEHGVVTTLPDELEHCIHLRYLRLGFAKGCKVSSVVWKLIYLQTLDLRQSIGTLLIPNEMWMLKKLVHLYLPSEYEILDDQKLRLSEPSRMETLINLHIRSFDEDDLRKLTNLRSVSFGQEVMSGEHLKLVLNQIVTSRLLVNPLSTLEINAEGINQDCQILTSNPHGVNIKWLTIWGRIDQSLNQIMFPRTLNHLGFHGSKIQGDCLPQLKFPNLLVLELGENAIKGNKIVLSSQSLPQLRELKLYWPWSSQNMKVEGELPERCQLIIWCPQRKLVSQVSSIVRKLNTSTAGLRPKIYFRVGAVGPRPTFWVDSSDFRSRHYEPILHPSPSSS